MRFECIGCKNQIEPTEPELVVSNHLVLSQAIFLHKERFACPYCHTEYVPLLRGVIGATWAYKKWEPQTQEAKITLAPKSLIV